MLYVDVLLRDDLADEDRVGVALERPAINRELRTLRPGSAPPPSDTAPARSDARSPSCS